MSKAITTGVLGSVVGIVSSIAGILWIIRYYALAGMHDVATGIQNLPITHPDLLQVSIFLGFFQNLHVSNALEGFIGVTFILGLLIAVTLILVGVGIYGLGKIEEKAIGTVALVFGIIGGVLALILLVAGAAAGANTPTIISIMILLNAPVLITTYPIPFIVLASGVPNVSLAYLWLGLIVVGVVMILFGAAFINVREGLTSPSLSVAAGVLSIIAGIFLFTGVLAPWIGFIILFVAFIMEIIIFAQSRELA